MLKKTRYYGCTKCKREIPRELLLVKKVGFFEMGVGGRQQRGRVTDWLCPDCVKLDVDWNRPAFVAPGNAPLRVAESASNG